MLTSLNQTLTSGNQRIVHAICVIYIYYRQGYYKISFFLMHFYLFKLILQYICTCFTVGKYLFQCMYLFMFKLSLHMLLFYTLVYESKLKNPLWLELASIDYLENSWLFLFFRHINYYIQYLIIVLYAYKKKIGIIMIIM